MSGHRTRGLLGAEPRPHSSMGDTGSAAQPQHRAEGAEGREKSLVGSEPASRRGSVSMGEKACSKPLRALVPGGAAGDTVEKQAVPEPSRVLLSGPRRLCPIGGPHGPQDQVDECFLFLPYCRKRASEAETVYLTKERKCTSGKRLAYRNCLEMGFLARGQCL